MIIIGAGLAGLLAARRLQHYSPLVIEQQETLPNNHSAILRFRSNAVGEALNIPFKKVRVYKGIVNQHNEIVNTVTIRDINAYSQKVVSRTMARSIVSLDTVDRWIAPNDLVPRLADGLRIEYGQSLDKATLSLGMPIISTIPMAKLTKITGYNEILHLKYEKVYNINCYLPGCDVYQTLYLPYEEQCACYRASITGNKLTLECNREIANPDQLIHYITSLLRLPGKVYDTRGSWQQYGKIIPINDTFRKTFILWATDKYNIYSLGRFATWRNILLDDVLKDIDIINQFIYQRSNYQRQLHYTGVEEKICR